MVELLDFPFGRHMAGNAVLLTGCSLELEPMDTVLLMTSGARGDGSMKSESPARLARLVAFRACHLRVASV